MSFIEPGGIGQLFATPGFSAWSLTANGGNIIYSNSNRTVVSSAGGLVTNVRGAKFHNINTGKFYFEVTFSGVPKSGTFSIGVVSSAWVPGTANIGNDANSFGVNAAGYWTEYYNSVAQAYSSAAVVASGDAIGVAVNFNYGAGFIGLCFSLNGIWLQNNSVTFPISSDFNLSVTSMAPACSTDGTGNMTLNVGNTSFRSALPAGYSAWG